MYSKKESPKITVAIRKRPLSKKEIGRGETDIVRIEDQGSVVISEVKYIHPNAGKKLISPSISKKPHSISIMLSMRTRGINKYMRLVSSRSSIVPFRAPRCHALPMGRLALAKLSRWREILKMECLDSIIWVQNRYSSTSITYILIDTASILTLTGECFLLRNILRKTVWFAKQSELTQNPGR